MLREWILLLCLNIFDKSRITNAEKGSDSLKPLMFRSDDDLTTTEGGTAILADNDISNDIPQPTNNTAAPQSRATNNKTKPNKNKQVQIVNYLLWSLHIISMQLQIYEIFTWL